MTQTSRSDQPYITRDLSWMTDTELADLRDSLCEPPLTAVRGVPSVIAREEERRLRKMEYVVAEYRRRKLAPGDIVGKRTWEGLMERRLQNGWIFRVDDDHAAQEVMIIVPNPSGGFIREPIPRPEWDSIVTDMGLPAPIIPDEVKFAQEYPASFEESVPPDGANNTEATSPATLVESSDSDALEPAPEPPATAEQPEEKPKRKRGRPPKVAAEA